MATKKYSVYEEANDVFEQTIIDLKTAHSLSISFPCILSVRSWEFDYQTLADDE